MSLPAKSPLSLLAICIFALSLPTGAAAQAMRPQEGPLSALTFVDPRLQPAAAGVGYESAGAALPAEVRSGWDAFLVRSGGDWQAWVDRRTGRIDFAEGAGLPWVPGDGNGLAPQDLPAGGPPDLSTLEGIARAFLPEVAPLLGVDPAALKLAKGRSGQPDAHLWLVDFDVMQGGLPVEGARVVFRVNNGNLIQFGTENLPAPGVKAPEERVSRKEALSALAEYVGGFSSADVFLDGGTTRLLPAAPTPGGAFEPGRGRTLLRAWEIVFQRKGVTGTWRARIDATTGRLLELRDVDVYARATGGVYPVSYSLGGETVLPMPYADLSSGGFTDSAGYYAYPGSPVTSTLNGKYVGISDTCGPVSLTSSPTGTLAFGASAGTDCSTPGTGGTGNTHAARMQYYHVNRAKEVARAWMPANTWLNGQVHVNVNIFDTCNAYWNGSLNFFRSSASCGNTGEIAGVSLHEYGHGLDSNDGNNLSPDLGTAEAYADITAALLLHDSCVGPGFFKNQNCGAYGDPCTSCTAVRDLDWAKHASNTPHTVDNFTRLRCPGGSGYAGPCGREGHCESYVASEAIWDLAARDLPGAGGPAAWSVTERLWYQTRSTSTSAFTCTNTSTPWTSSGCAAGTLWRTLRAADDDDGNLANGTPHSCQLFAAFDRHGIACAADAGANVCFSGCVPPATPAVTAAAGDRQVTLSWAGAAGAVYDVFRSESGCGTGFLKVADDVAGPFTDGGLANGLTYSYQVVAQATGNGACAAPPSTCQSATPQSIACGSLPAPTGLTATVAGVDRISLSWGPSAGAPMYRIYRGTSPGGPYALAGSVNAPATSWVDTGLESVTTYFYVVKPAGEDCEGPSASNQASATTAACQPIALYTHDFESGSGLSDWTVGSFNGGSTADWRGIQSCPAHGGTGIFRFGGETCGGDYSSSLNSFAEPQGATGIQVPAGTARTRLSFWHRWEIETGYDGATLSLSVDGTDSIRVPSTAIVGGATYNGAVYNYCAPPGTAGTPTFTGFQESFVHTEVDLDKACDLASGTPGGCAGRPLWIGFSAITDCVYEYSGWFLDDVTVTTCAPVGCTGPPALAPATLPADNQVSLVWSNGSPASTTFGVYRAFGTCAAPGTFTRIASGVTASSYLDTPVSGGAAYAYKVVGVDAGGICESYPSACVDAVPTGPCTLTPTFGGLGSIEDPVTGTCALGLSWSPGVSRCGAGVTYDVYRSTSATFTPSPANRIATGVAGTSFQDSGSLDYGTAYYYVVRAVDSANGQDDGNSVRRGLSPTGPLILPATRHETFEAAGGFDLAGWSHAPLLGGYDWTLTTDRSQTPTHAWHSPGLSTNGHRVLVSPAVHLAADTVLSFWHTFQFESCFDGATLEISTDNGATWSVLPDSAFLAGGFNGTLFATNNPLHGRRGWCNGTLGAMTQVRVDLGAWDGSEARIRWRAGEDASNTSPGWYVDSVTFENIQAVDACLPSPPPALDFHTTTPCRLIDTRWADGTLGGPALQAGQIRAFPLAAVCGIPATARALSVNVTVVEPGAGGYLSLFRADQVAPATSSISFQPGRTRANNALVGLSDTGALKVKAGATVPVHFVLDVNGWFE